MPIQPSQHFGDSRLLSLQRDGKDALAELFQQEESRIKRMIQANVDPALAKRLDASDILQDSYLVATKELRAYLADPQYPPFIWLRRIVAEEMRKKGKYHRDVKKRSVDFEETSVHDELSVSLPSPRGHALQEEQLKRIRVVIDEMSGPDREILVLRHVEQLSMREISIELDQKYETVKKRYTRALKKLRGRIKNLEN